MDTEMKTYEADFLLKGDLGEEKALEAGESLRKLIENEQGIITKEFAPKKQNLGYPIKKHMSGFFGYFKFVFPVEKIKSLKNSFEKNDLLRLLLTEAKKEKDLNRSPLKRGFRKISSRPAAIKESASVKIEGEGATKEPVITRGGAASTANKPLQVEELDKKLEEILG